jgi:hypothetical protein
VRAALYVTIWASMVALAASEGARRRGGRFGAISPLALSAIGLATLVVHIAIAIFHHHGGDHAAAVTETARLTEQVYGVAWGGGVYVNYAFVATWAAYVWWWRAHAEPLDNTNLWVLAIRAAFFVIIFNALVVFASPLTRPLGIVLCLVLTWAWRPGRARAAVRTS